MYACPTVRHSFGNIRGAMGAENANANWELRQEGRSSLLSNKTAAVERRFKEKAGKQVSRNAIDYVLEMKNILVRRYKFPSEKWLMQMVVTENICLVVMKQAREGILSGRQYATNSKERFLGIFFPARPAVKCVQLFDIYQRTVPKHDANRSPLINMSAIKTPFQ